jgi:hypothetical protein
VSAIALFSSSRRNGTTGAGRAAAAAPFSLRVKADGSRLS